MPNRLADETSPYLLQHKDNPVDWYPWGPEALAKARQEERPIFLSVGYAACHWCHVMEHESFEDPATAEYLNAHFVPIKVDREERPDIDALYMESVQAMTGHGGWPMSVFLTPDAKPFYGGTYFPNTSRYGMPSFTQVLEGVAEAWSTRRSDVEQSASRVADAIARSQREATETRSSTAGTPPTQAPAATAAATSSPTGLTDAAGRPIASPAARATAGPGLAVPSPAAPATPAPDPGILDAAIARLTDTFDWTHGSWGGAPKFPQPMTIEFLLRRIAGQQDATSHTRADGSELDPPAARLLGMVTKTLDAMADGGIRDQLGGGFHRYSTDEVWLVPHFEKMLYDNAQLARAYLHAWQLTGEPRYRAVVESTLDYVAREMTLPEGGFAASQDADSPGPDGHPEEGAFYVWALREIEEALGDEGALFATTYDVRSIGNWEGKTILRRVRSDAELVAFASADSPARADPADPAGVPERLARARAKLLEIRDRRPRPARDDKALASWNGLMLAAFAEAARALDRSDYLAVAEQDAGFVLARLRTPEGKLRRSWKDGRATLNAYLEDYANVAEGLLALYETTFDDRWYAAARDLADQILARFGDPDGGFFDTSDDHETLVARPKGLQDNAVPSGNAMAATVLLKFAAWSGGGRYRDAAEQALAVAAPYLGRYPTGFAQWLTALDFALAPVREVSIVVADRAEGQMGPEAASLLGVVRDGFRPHQVVALGPPDGTAQGPPLLHDRSLVDGKPAAYVCRGFACDLPVVEPEALRAKLGSGVTAERLGTVSIDR